MLSQRMFSWTRTGLLSCPASHSPLRYLRAKQKAQLFQWWPVGTSRYIDPLYGVTGSVTEYIDVYSFRVVLLVLLSGKREGVIGYVKDLYEKDKLDEVIDTKMVKDMTSGQRFQVEACVALALRCCEKIDEYRPKMIEVAKELKRIQTSF
ncbi:unnamed protein product [Brassica rapa subsp. trilocularis]